jgi:hypothetical protein
MEVVMKRVFCWITSPLIFTIVIGLSGQIAHARNINLLFNAANFSSPQDNLFLPMAIGATYVYRAEDEDGVVLNEITQTSQTKVILGVTTTVVHDVEFLLVEGVGSIVTEETFDWIAWDNSGNVWYFGEDTTEYLYDENWNLIGTTKEGSWQAGVDGAKPGILMLADPAPGDSYRQEFFEGVAEDTAKVLNLNGSVSVEYGDFHDVLKTKEWTPLEPGAVEHKFYAADVGLVFIEQLKGKTVRVELVDIQ